MSAIEREQSNERGHPSELAGVSAPLAAIGFDAVDCGPGAALRNRPFRLLWLAELATQTAQNALWYTALVLVERATQSTALISLSVVSAVLPAALFGMFAGLVVDRWPKKLVLVLCNVLRALAVLLYLLHRETVFAVFAANFVVTAVAQFFIPAQLASIPHFLPKRQITGAMGLFNLTWTVAQCLGLIVLGPLLLNLLGFAAGTLTTILSAAAIYALAAGLMVLLPHDATDDAERAAHTGEVRPHPLRSLWRDFHEGLSCIHGNVPTRLAILYLALTTTLLLAIATLAPRFAVSVLGIGAADAILLIAPAGLAMAGAASMAHHLTRRFTRERLIQRGLLTMVGALLALAAVGPVQEWLWRSGLMQPVAPRGWHLLVSRVGVAMVLAAIIGWQVGMVLAPSQAIVAEWAPRALRGRIFAIQQTIVNLAAIPPLLVLGTLADSFGIPAVIALLAAGVLALWLLTLRRAEVLVLHPADTQHPYSSTRPR